MAVSKKELAILLSKLKSFSGEQAKLEQYPTPSEIAADALWMAFLSGDIEGKNVADLGCGNGVLGCGTLLLGAKHVIFLDVDRKVLAVTKENVEILEKVIKKTFSCSYLLKNVDAFHESVDCVVENPPFGVQSKHADRNFLLAGINASVAYSFHKLDTKDFIEEFVRNHHKNARLLKTYSFPLRKTMPFHTKNVYAVDVGLWRVS